MNRRSTAILGASALLGVAVLTGCSAPTTAGAGGASSPSAAPTAAGSDSASQPAPGQTGSSPAGVVLPVTSNPISNASTAATLVITKASVEDNTDPITGKAIDDRLQLTLKNTGTAPLTGFEVYYSMTDIVTKQTEGYYQKLEGLTVAAGSEATIYFDNLDQPGHYPENQFSIYRSSTNEVDFAIQVSAAGAKIANATAVKATGTGEKVD